MAASPVGQEVYLRIFNPPSIAADGKVYPFLVQAYVNESVGPVPVKINASLLVTTTSSTLLPIDDIVDMVEGQVIVNFTATYPSAPLAGDTFVQITISGQNLESAVSAVQVLPPWSPYQLAIAAPAYAPASGSFPVEIGAGSLIRGAYVPVNTSLPVHITTDVVGSSMITIRQNLNVIESLTADAGSTDITVAGNYFNEADASVSSTNSSNAFGCAFTGYGIQTVAPGVWPVFFYATGSVNRTIVVGNTTSIVTESVMCSLGGLNLNQAALTSNVPQIGSVISLQPYNQNYLEGLVNVTNLGTFTVKMQASGFKSTPFDFTSIAANTPFKIGTYGPSISQGRVQLALQLLSYDGLPAHLLLTPIVTLSPNSTTTVMPIVFNDGWAFVSVNGTGYANVFVQAQGMYRAKFTVGNSVYVPPPPPLPQQPYNLTLRANAPIQFTLNWINKTGPFELTSPVNKTVLLQDPVEVSAPENVTVGKFYYVFQHWQDKTTSLTQNTNFTETLTATYSRTNIAITLFSNISFKLNGTVAGKPFSVPLNQTFTSPRPVNVTIPFTVLGNNSNYQYVFGGWSDGYSKLSRLLSPGGNYTARYLTQYDVTGSTDHSTINGLGYHTAGSNVTLSAADTTVSGGLPLVSDHISGWVINGQTVNKPTASFVITGPTTVKAVWSTDYTMLIIAIAGAGGGGGGGAFLLIRRRKNKPAESSDDDSVL